MDRALDDLEQSWPLAAYIRDTLGPKPVVVIAGAYKGIVMHLAAERWKAGLVVGFEPQGWAFEEAQRRISVYPQCRIYPFGLGTETRRVLLGEYGTDACSMVNTGPGARSWGEGFVVDSLEALTGLVFYPRRWEIDLLVLNMEGYEFRLLPYLLAGGIKPRAIAVQFHFGIGGDEDRYAEIQDTLAEDYVLVVDARPAWEYWKRRW